MAHPRLGGLARGSAALPERAGGPHAIASESRTLSEGTAQVCLVLQCFATASQCLATSSQVLHEDRFMDLVLSEGLRDVA